ncbi:hypothetical protein [Streptomyces coeruleorubidus]|uniref:hypothetical protein n=1 Tax=Streptomyces coeruleorubidus TaxID=116188 RepID=UPI0033FD8C64
MGWSIERACAGALDVAHRRQGVDGDGALHETTRVHTERFTTAVSRLCNESTAVHLGGVHALAHDIARRCR